MFYQITNLFPISNYSISFAQADLFKFGCVKRIMSQGLVIKRDSDAYACLSSFPLYRSHDQQNKQEAHWSQCSPELTAIS